MISHHKSKEVINIAWFGHTSLLPLKKRGRLADIFPVLHTLTHMEVILKIGLGGWFGQWTFFFNRCLPLPSNHGPFYENCRNKLPPMSQENGRLQGLKENNFHILSTVLIVYSIKRGVILTFSTFCSNKNFIRKMCKKSKSPPFS